MGSALMGPQRISSLSTEGLFACSRRPTFPFAKVPGRTLFPPSGALEDFMERIRAAEKMQSRQGWIYYM